MGKKLLAVSCVLLLAAASVSSIIACNPAIKTQIEDEFLRIFCKFGEMDIQHKHQVEDQNRR